MTYRVKSFTGYDANEVERKISEWLQKKRDIEIIEVSQSQNSENDIVVFIFYREIQ